MLIYDIEIEKAIQSKNEERIANINYCNGWQDHANMGISVIGAYDYETDRYHVFCKDNFDRFLHLLANHSCVVGFNSRRFDNRVIACQTEGIVKENLEKYFSIATYDILEEIWKSLGLDPDKFYWGTHGGYGLDVMCESNFGTKKSGNGALAPVDWQQGKIGTVIDYCLNDVRLTKQLLDRIRLSNYLKCPKTGKELLIRNPYSV